MSQLVRRITAAVVLAAILCLATPAGATSRPLLPLRGTAAVLGSLWDQVVTWLAGLWSDRPPEATSPETKGFDTVQPPSEDETTPIRRDRSVLIDPNG